jgi:hypothetical protein
MFLLCAKSATLLHHCVQSFKGLIMEPVDNQNQMFVAAASDTCFRSTAVSTRDCGTAGGKNNAALTSDFFSSRDNDVKSLLEWLRSASGTAVMAQVGEQCNRLTGGN